MDVDYSRFSNIIRKFKKNSVHSEEKKDVENSLPSDPIVVSSSKFDSWIPMKSNLYKKMHMQENWIIVSVKFEKKFWYLLKLVYEGVLLYRF